jgi:hypothetical protein
LALLAGCGGSSDKDYHPVPEVLPQAPNGLTGYSAGDAVWVDVDVGARVCRAAVAAKHQIPVDLIDVVENTNGNFVVVALPSTRAKRACLVGTNALVQEAEGFGSDGASTFAFLVAGDQVDLRAITSVGTLAPPVQVVVRR